METKIAMNPYIRTKISENHEQMAEIRRSIMDKVEMEYAEEVKALKTENDSFYAMDKEFRKNAQEVLKKAYTDRSEVLVQSQVGKNGSIIHSYRGRIVELWGSDSGFNMIDPNVYDGKPFSIGMSCFLSIEII